MKKRNFPSPSNSLLFFIDERRTGKGNIEEAYEKAMINLETSMEKDLLEILKSLDISSSVKSDRYSLPYNNTIEHTGYGESYLNAAYDRRPFFKKIVKELLDKDPYKIRFFIFAEVEDAIYMGKVKYYFNYYVHN